MEDFGGRVVVITGAGSGIGAALAHGFAAEGATVAAVDIDGDAAARTAAEVGGAASAHGVDVGDGMPSSASPPRSTRCTRRSTCW